MKTRFKWHSVNETDPQTRNSGKPKFFHYLRFPKTNKQKFTLNFVYHLKWDEHFFIFFSVDLKLLDAYHLDLKSFWIGTQLMSRSDVMMRFSFCLSVCHLFVCRFIYYYMYACVLGVCVCVVVVWCMRWVYMEGGSSDAKGTLNVKKQRDKKNSCNMLCMCALTCRSVRFTSIFLALLSGLVRFGCSFSFSIQWISVSVPLSHIIFEMIWMW